VIGIERVSPILGEKFTEDTERVSKVCSAYTLDDAFDAVEDRDGYNMFSLTSFKIEYQGFYSYTCT